ncbi:acyl carrier protein phosphodiesterase [Litoribacter populi]|uniref:acyl carrier protein phosphodiesterase n=1 Tax=Litoribacter populi TaxID=2598460 RepID=UPI00117C30A8|nr:ACP phosphodiesterase [Litoribacter populi]
MNFLAHAYLSFGEPKVLIGNFIADFVRGDLTKTYDTEVIIGVKLHRAIDAYTDSHPEVKAVQELLKPAYARYSSVISDMFFDHFLAVSWSEYHNVPIKEFSQEVYKVMTQFTVDHPHPLPEKFNIAFDLMVKNDWLMSYTTIAGMKQAMKGMANRTTFESKMETSHLFLQEHYEEIKAPFHRFFPQLVEFSKRHLEELKEKV